MDCYNIHKMHVISEEEYHGRLSIVYPNKTNTKYLIIGENRVVDVNEVYYYGRLVTEPVCVVKDEGTKFSTKEYYNFDFIDRDDVLRLEEKLNREESEDLDFDVDTLTVMVKKSDPLRKRKICFVKDNQVYVIADSKVASVKNFEEIGKFEPMYLRIKMGAATRVSCVKSLNREDVVRFEKSMNHELDAFSLKDQADYVEKNIQ